MQWLIVGYDGMQKFHIHMSFPYETPCLRRRAAILCHALMIRGCMIKFSGKPYNYKGDIRDEQAEHYEDDGHCGAPPSTPSPIGATRGTIFEDKKERD